MTIADNNNNKEDLSSMSSYASNMADVAPPPLPGVPARYEPSTFSANNDEIVRLRHLGMQVQDIATSMGLQKRVVTEFLKTDMARDRLQDLSLGRDDAVRDISKQIDAMQPGALKVLKDIIEGETEAHIALKQKTAVEVLGMGGNGKTIKVEGRHIHGVLIEGGLAAVSRRVIEMELAAESGNLVGGNGAISNGNQVPLAEVVLRDGS